MPEEIKEMEVAETVEAAETVETTVSVEATESVESAATMEATESVETAATMEATESVEAAATMEVTESMEDYSKELEASFRKVSEGDLLKGTVISVNEEEVILDLNYYAQGVIKAEDMSNDPGFSLLNDVKVGDVLEASVVKTDDGAGNIRLSRKEAADAQAWEVLSRYKEEETDLSVKISGVVNAGVIAYVEGIRGFIPASQLSLQYVEDLNAWLGRLVTARVITVEEEKQKLVLSAKVVEREKEQEALNHKVSMLVPGTILEGKVESLMQYGAFVALPGGMSGLVHISQISQKRIKKPSELLAVGDIVKVKILNTNDGKISLSIKAVEEDRETEEMAETNSFQYSSGESATTSLGSLLANIKL